jgi:hypothetical protein
MPGRAQANLIFPKRKINRWIEIVDSIAEIITKDGDLHPIASRFTIKKFFGSDVRKSHRKLWLNLLL